MITAELLRKFAPRLSQADAEMHACALEEAREESTVNSCARLCALLGQVAVETNYFQAMEENLRYKDPARLDSIFSAVKGDEDAKRLIAKGPEAIANRVYANRLGNGDEASGDGWAYRGSGYVMLTGRENYRSIGKLVGMDLEGQPDLARDPKTAAQIAFKFWDARECSACADRDDIGLITHKVNGPARLHLKERKAATQAAKLAMGGSI